MKISVLGNEGSLYVDELSRAAIERGHRCQQVDFRRLSSAIQSSSTSGQQTIVTAESNLSSQTHLDRQLLNDSDAIIVRTMPPGSLEQVVYRMDVLLELQQTGKAILNHPRAIECAVDKFLTTSRLANAGLPIPRTVVCETTEQAMEAFEILGRDVVVKPIFGAEGRGIFRLSDADLAFRSFRTLERLNNIIYVQKFIEHPGHDIRILILGDTIIGAIKRQNPNDFRTNVSRQGLAEQHNWNDHEAVLAFAAAKTVHATFAGVDLLYDAAGDCYVIEVNGVPGWRAFQKATGIDVARRVIESLEK